MVEQSETDFLREARVKTRNILAQLLAQQSDLENHASRPHVALAPEKLAAGQEAFTRAIQSTRQTLERIDQVLQTAR